MGVLFLLSLVHIIVMSSQSWTPPVYRDCCKTNQSNCIRSEIYRLLDYCDNRYGAERFTCEGVMKSGSNREEWDEDAYMRALGMKNGFRSAIEYVLSFYNSPTANETENSFTKVKRKHILSSTSGIYRIEVPTYSISRVYEKLQICGETEVIPLAPFSVTLTSTTRCNPTDRWEYLDQDCDNSDNGTHSLECELLFSFGTRVGEYSSSTLHKLGLTVSELVEGIEHNFEDALNPSTVTKQYWSEISSSVWTSEIIAKALVSSDATYNTRYYQLVGICAEYEVYTNVIKPVIIPSLDFCNRTEETLLVAEYKLTKHYVQPEQEWSFGHTTFPQHAEHCLNKAILEEQQELQKRFMEYKISLYDTQYHYGAPNLTHIYYIHPVGIDFPTREDDTEGLRLLEVYYNLTEDTRIRFDEIANVSELDNGILIHKNVFNNFAKLVDTCPWMMVGEGCGKPEHLLRYRNTSQLGTYTAHQLIGKCGDITIYTDYLIIMVDGVLIDETGSYTLKTNECLIKSAKDNDTTCYDEAANQFNETHRTQIKTGKNGTGDLLLPCDSTLEVCSKFPK